MKKIFILFFIAFILAGCDFVSLLLLGNQPENQIPENFDFKTVPFKKDFYGRPIFVTTFSSSNVDYGQALYHALNNSLARNPNAFFLIVAYSDNNYSVEKNALKLRQEMENLGINNNKVIIKYEKKNAGEIWNSVKLYER